MCFLKQDLPSTLDSSNLLCLCAALSVVNVSTIAVFLKIIDENLSKQGATLLTSFAVPLSLAPVCAT